MPPLSWAGIRVSGIRRAAVPAASRQHGQNVQYALVLVAFAYVARMYEPWHGAHVLRVHALSGHNVVVMWSWNVD